MHSKIRRVDITFTYKGPFLLLSTGGFTVCCSGGVINGLAVSCLSTVQCRQLKLYGTEYCVMTIEIKWN